jgi:hypothetical protein
MPDARLTRRVAGVLATRLPELELEEAADPRSEHGRKWQLATLLRSIIVGMAAGRRSLAEVEHLSDEMSLPVRRMLRIPRRVPDTTMRDAAVRIDPDELRRCLRQQAKSALRRKALEPFHLPFGVVAMDGKATAATAWDDDGYAQRQPHSSALGASGIVRTVSCTLVSSRVRAYLDAVPIPAETNEVGHFSVALDSLWDSYKDCEQIKMVSYDSGGCSKANAEATRSKGLHYMLRLDAAQPTLFLEAKRLLGHLPVSAAVTFTSDQTGTGTERRYLFITEQMVGCNCWEHLRTVARVHSVKRDREGRLIPQKEHECDRYYMFSMPRGRLTDDQWLLLIRLHWGVEVLEEDRHPFIEANPQGMLVLMLLRRMAYNLLALFRSVTQRSEEKRQTPWRDILRWFYNTMIVATEAHLEGLRPRSVPAPVA